MLNKRKTANRKGYTLIELLVGVAVFTILMAASVEFFVSSLEMQQKALLSQRLLDNVSYTFEYIGRALRMAKKDETPSCLTSKDDNYEITRAGKGIKFLNYNDECWEFYLSTTPNSAGAHNLMVVRDPSIGPTEEDSLTSEFLDVTNFQIVPSGWNPQPENLQPKVTIFLEAKMIKSKKPELQPSIKMQTTISQRNLDD